MLPANRRAHTLTKTRVFFGNVGVKPENTRRKATPPADSRGLVCAGQGGLGESEPTAEAAGRGQVQPRHAGLHHERRL